MSDEGVTQHFDLVAVDYDRWKEKASYYYETLKTLLADVIPPGSQVCEVGCATGDILTALRPALGVGVDVSSEMIRLARAKHPDLRFEVHDILSGPIEGRFDYVLAVDVMEHLSSPETGMKSMSSMLAPGGALVVTTANPSWAPTLALAEKLRLKMPEGRHTWRSLDELASLGRRVGLSVESADRSFLVPKRVPLLHHLNTVGWARSLRRRLGLIQRVVFNETPIG